MLRWSALVGLGAFLILLANDPGRMFFDTKLSVDLNAYAFYASLWHLMDPLNTFGALNNQAIGYAVPMAPFYLAGHLAHVPVWLIERLWLSLIIAVGFGGLVKLARSARHRVAGLALPGRAGVRAVADVHDRDRVHLVRGAAGHARPVGGTAAGHGRPRPGRRGRGRPRAPAPWCCAWAG